MFSFLRRSGCLGWTSSRVFTAFEPRPRLPLRLSVLVSFAAGSCPCASEFGGADRTCGLWASLCLQEVLSGERFWPRLCEPLHLKTWLS